MLTKVLVKFLRDDTPFRAGEFYEVSLGEAKKFERQNLVEVWSEPEDETEPD